MSFTDDALDEIAARAMERDTGARALRSIVEEFMLDYMYDLPEFKGEKEFVVTGEVVRGEASLLKPEKVRKESA